MRLTVGAAATLGLLASLLVLFAVSCSGAGLSQVASADARQVQNTQGSSDGDLGVERPAPNEVRGALDRPGIPAVRFTSKVVAPQDKDGRPNQSDEFVVTRVEAGALTLEAERNLRTRSITAGGHGDRITLEQRRALLVLCKELEGRFGNLGTAAQLEEDQLVRITCYYAEAPVGHKLISRTETPEESRDVSEDSSPKDGSTTGHVHVKAEPDTLGSSTDLTDASYRINLSESVSAAVSDECVHLRTLEDEGRLEGSDFASYVACQRSDEDGISYLTCQTRKHRLWHDSNVDCFHSRARYTGPCVRYCTGRCGPGCGLGQHEGVYARDCGEHDDCLTNHPNCRGINGNDRCCGDEFDHAFNDTVNGNQNCSGRRCS